MLAFNNNRPPANWNNFDSCASLNNWRGHHRRQYNRKYPLATIHSLLSLMQDFDGLPLEIDAMGPLMFADGVYKILLNYTENSWDWMRYMGVENPKNPLHRYFLSPDLAVFQLVSVMLDFWERRDQFSVRGQRGDRISITERSGNQGVINLTETTVGSNRWIYDRVSKARNEEFIGMLAELTGWAYIEDRWCWQDFKLWEFEKETITCSNIPTFNEAIAREPISFALTGQSELQIAFPGSDGDPFV